MYLVAPRPINVQLFLAGTELNKHFLNTHKLYPPSISSIPLSIHPSYRHLSWGGSPFSDDVTEASASPGPSEASSYVPAHLHQETFGTPQACYGPHRSIPHTSTDAGRAMLDRSKTLARPPAPASSILGRCSLRGQSTQAENTAARSVNRKEDTIKPSTTQYPHPIQRRSAAPPQARAPPSEVAQIPLWEEPVLFAGVRASERYYSHELCDEEDEILIPRRPSSNAAWAGSHIPQPKVTPNSRQDCRPYPAPAPARQEHYSFKKHPIPISGPNPFRSSPLINPWVIRGITRLIDEEEEDIIVYDPHGTTPKAAAAEAEYNRQMQRPRIPYEAIINQGAYTRFAEERRLHSPLEKRRRLPGEYSAQLTEDQGPVTDFDDFPVCEMSIAMGLHEPSHRANVDGM
ncbi:hypothetical protein H0H87_007973 [Tephrocybe sp. NHM501043]|nr:hypothetical protein H0H87_007973 [Tephrocybe sp. NHM501043]